MSSHNNINSIVLHEDHMFGIFLEFGVLKIKWKEISRPAEIERLYTCTTDINQKCCLHILLYGRECVSDVFPTY